MVDSENKGHFNSKFIIGFCLLGCTGIWYLVGPNLGRTEVAEMVELADIVKEKARIYYSTEGKWPESADAAEVGLDVLDDGMLGIETANSRHRAYLKPYPNRPNVVVVSIGMLYIPVVRKSSTLTWRCIWSEYAEEKYPGAKPDDCEDEK